MLRNIFTTYLARFASILSTFLLLPIVVPAVGMDTYGLYALVSSMGILFAQDLGMASATVKYSAEAAALSDLPRLKSVCAASTWYFVFISILFTALFAIALVYLMPTIDIPTGVNASVLSILGLANLFFGVALSSHRQVLAGVGKLDVVNVIQIGQAILRILTTVVVVYVTRDIVAVALVDLVLTLLAGLLTWLFRRRLAPESITKPSMFRWKVLRQLFGFSLDLLVMSLAAAVILQSGTVLASLLLPLGAVAIYTAANRAFLLVREAANSLTMALLPAASSNAASGRQLDNTRLFLGGTRIANAAMILLLVPLVVSAQTLMNLWVGPELAVGYQAAQVLMLSMLANNNHLIAIPVLTGSGGIRPYAVLHALWAFSGILLAPPLASTLGVVGIALALSIPVVVLEPVYVWVALKRIGVDTRVFLVQALAIPYGLAAAPTVLLLLFVGNRDLDLTVMFAAPAIWLTLMIFLYWRFLLLASERMFIKKSILRR